MSLRLQSRDNVRDAIRRVERERIAAAQELIRGAAQVSSSKGIHQARKQLKRARALLRLIRPDISRGRWTRVDHRLRQVARALSAVRDATVLVDTLQEFRARHVTTADSLTNVRITAHHRQAQAHDSTLASDKARKKLQRLLGEAAHDLDQWTAIHRGWKAIGPGLRAVYSEAQAAAVPLRQVADCDNLTLHKARKRAQTLLHVLEFLQSAQPRRIGARIHALHELTDLLGKDHDLAVLEGTLHDSSSTRLTAAGLRGLSTAMATDRRTLKTRASRLAGEIYTETEDAFVSEIREHWKAWRAKTSRS
jgi:CHAD domain-containing protein